MERSQGIFPARKLASTATNTKTHPSRRAIFPARAPWILHQRKVRDCRQGQLLLPRQGSSRCLSHVHSIAETLSQTNKTAMMVTTITMSIRHPLAPLFCLSTQSMEASFGKMRVSCGIFARLVWKSARCLWNSARFLQHLLWENSIRCGFGECAERGRRAPEPIRGTIANFASTIIFSWEQQETRWWNCSRHSSICHFCSSRVFQWRCARC